MLNKFKSLLAKDNRAKRTEPALRLVEIRKGTKPVIIIINGFLSENDEDVTDWLKFVDQLYPKNEVLHAKWSAGNLAGMVKDKGFSAGISPLLKVAIGTSPLVKVLSTAATAVNKATGHWKNAFHETKEVGLELAVALEADEALHGSILMGHSLGARVIYHTLAELDKPIVNIVYLLAGAVSSEQEQWSDIFRNHPNTKFINCISQKDSVLKKAYKLGCLFDHKPAGLSPLCEESSLNVINLDVTEHANGHFDFKHKKLGLFLKEELMDLKPEKIEALAFERK